MGKLTLKGRIIRFFSKRESKASKAERTNSVINVNQINAEAPGRSYPAIPVPANHKAPTANGHRPGQPATVQYETESANGIANVPPDSPSTVARSSASFTVNGKQGNDKEEVTDDENARTTSLGSQKAGSAVDGRDENQHNNNIRAIINGGQIKVGGAEVELDEIVISLRDGDVDARSAAAERLFNKAAVDQSARLRTTSMGVVQPLVRLLYDGKERGKLYAAYALSSIMTPTQPMTEVRAAGVIPALIFVLNNSRHLASKKGAMRAIGRLARVNETAAEIVEANGLPPIIALLDCEDLGIVKRCLIALFFIGADKEELQSQMADLGVTAPVVRLCRHAHPEIQDEAVDIVKVLARHPRNAAIIMECEITSNSPAGGLEALTWIAEKGQTDRAKASAIKAIQRLAMSPALEQRVRTSPAAAFVPQELAHSPDPVKKLAKLITQGPQHDRTDGAREVADALKADPTVTSELAAGGMVGPLVQMLSNSEIQGQVYAAGALTRMASDANVQEQIVAAGAIPPLIALMQDNRGAAAAAAGAIESLAGQPKFAAAIIRARGVSALVGLLNAGSLEAFLPTMRALRELSGLDENVSQLIVKAEGVTPLVRRSAKGSAEVRAASLWVLRDIAQHKYPLIESGGVAVLAALEQSAVAEVRKLSSNALNLQAQINRQCAESVEYERGMQKRIGMLISELKNSMSIPIPYNLEEAMRMVPRHLFLSQEKANDGYKNKSLRVSIADVQLSSPSIDALALSYLNPEPGHSFLDVGSGSGYTTMLASHMVAYSGAAVGVDIRELVVEYCEARVADIKDTRGLTDLSLTFLRGSIFGHPSLRPLGRFDRIYVGANCPKSRLRDLLRLLKPGGKMVVACEGQLLLLTQPVDGRIPEPGVLSTVPMTEVLHDDEQGQGTPGLATSPPRQRHFPPTSKIFTTPHEAAQKEAAQRAQGQSPDGQPRGLTPPGILDQPPTQQSDSLPSSRPQGDAARDEEQNGWYISREDIRICHDPSGKKIRLGEGGFGVVFKALMSGVDETAVKLVKNDRPSQREMALFHKEVKILRTLHHKNIVQFYGANLEPGNMFFVTELMKGGDLYAALRNHPETMRWDKLGRKVAQDIALGINYLHTRRPPMMHRDLKSPNVLLSVEGVAKIADVGMVRAQVKDLVTAQPIMTPLWAAPEVIRHERASVKADMWSYGILIWELVSGQDITENQPLAIARQMHGPQRAKTLELPPNCPSIARHLFEHCTQDDPEARPSASKVVEWLRSHLAYEQQLHQQGR